MTIRVRDVHEESCDLYDPNNNFIGTIGNLLQFEDTMVQISRAKANGYYIKFRGKRYEIHNSGKLPIHPDGLFDKIYKLVSKLK